MKEWAALGSTHVNGASGQCDSCCFVQKSWPEKLHSEHLKKEKNRQADFSQWETPSSTAKTPEAPYLSGFATTPQGSRLPKSWEPPRTWPVSPDRLAGFAGPAHVLVGSMGRSCACKFAV